ncbi:MAG TPA: OmpA family protein [Polyangia bacterium]|jgi:peptidoglycan-associated lipoprotein|nr:OmpA family protein [Polyangia bacterium]
MRRQTNGSGYRALIVLLWGLVPGWPSGCAHEQPSAPKRAPAVVAETPTEVKPPSPTAAVEEKAPSVSDLREDGPAAIFFDFDSSLLQDEARDVLAKIADEAKQRAKTQLVIEGNCDDLGTVEYNLALGQHRAEAAKQFLIHMGVPARRIKTASYGSQRQKYSGRDDVARAKNRRDDFIFRDLRDARGGGRR